MSSPGGRTRDANAAKISRRAAVFGVGFALTAAAAAAVTPRRHERTIGAARLDEIVPARVGPWSVQAGARMILPQDDQPSDVYDQLLTRAYAAPGRPEIMLLIAYGAAQSGLMKVHRPEVCYASSGFRIRGDRAVDIALAAGAPIAAKTFLALRQDRAEQVLYWTRISDTFPRDLSAQRLVMVERGLTGVIPDGVLVRCSTLGADLTAGQGAMKDFAAALVAGSGALGRALLVGGGAALG